MRPTSRPTRSGAARRPLATLVAVAAGLALLVGGLLQVRLETSLDSFLPAGDPELAAYDELAAQFGGEPVVVLLEGVGEEGFTSAWLEQMLRLEGELAADEDVAVVFGPGTLLNQLAGQAQDLLTQLLGRRDAEVARARALAEVRGATPAEAAAAARRTEARFDARYATLLVGGLPAGLPTLRNDRFARAVVFDEGGLPRGQWRFVVPERDAVAILVRPDADLDAVASAGLVERIEAMVADLAPPGLGTTVTGAPALISSVSDTSAEDGPVLGALAVLAVGLCFLGAVFLRRSRRLAPLATTAVAVAATLSLLGWLDRPVSLGVVAFCSVLLGIGCYYPTYFAMGARPRTVLVVAAATATSLGTLVLTPLPLVQDLGLTLAAGVAFSALLALPLRTWLGTPGPANVAPLEDRGAVLGGTGRQARLAARAALVAVGAVAVLGWVQLPSIEVETDVDHFAGGLPAYAEAQRAEEVLGSSGEVDVVLRRTGAAEDGGSVLTPEALAWTRSVEETVVTGYGDRLRPALSTAGLLRFLGPDPTAEEVAAGARLLPPYLLDAVTTPDRATALMSFGVRLDDLPDLRRTVEEVTDRVPPAPLGYEAETVGLPLVLLRAEELVSEDRVLANVLGIFACVGVLLVGLRRRADALRAGAAAVLATGVGFAAVAATGTALNPITVGLGALTAAVGCEFTVVYAEAVRRGSRRLRAAVCLVALTSTAGYLVLLASQLGAIRSFGTLLAGAVVLALGASVLVVVATVRPEPGGDGTDAAPGTTTRTTAPATTGTAGAAPTAQPVPEVSHA